ncbi:hypothetical protein CI109_100322 [Kwoniella shandongensis]|uniref:Uncharacterized protein n=1 Tax=Kwoniella shandongensis TaxID=1734106 RepID=A0A5M6C7X3_9TREE|nr:uncharacterized protein CI109_001832 [Kwoniella shandongensis]KAA5529892.1 hypothetical protein CI109_001832 [Kwoniella shandongensis]
MPSQLITQIRTLAQPPSSSSQLDSVRKHIDVQFSDLDALLKPPRGGVAGPSKRRKRNLEEEIGYWEEKEARANIELEETSSILPPKLEETQEKLQTLLSSAQGLSLKRYELADKLANLVSELSSSNEPQPKHQHDGGAEAEGSEEKGGEEQRAEKTVLEQMEEMQVELGRLEAGLAWARALEQVVTLSEATLSTTNHKPSPLAALPHYRRLNDFVSQLEDALPSEMALVKVVRDVREQTWTGLKEVMSQNLSKACDTIGWPRKVVYETVTVEARRAFERSFQDLLILQAEGEDLHGQERPPHWSAGKGLYPIQAMVQPIALRFRYHFQGSKGTNRVDKPEWAFANILDQIYEHQTFITTYLQPLSAKAGYDSIDIRSEFTMLLFPILLSLLRSRIPHLLDHPALLAHTIYQTVVFDEAVKEGGFDLDGVSIFEGRESGVWEGLTGVVLREEDWFTRWVAGEKKFADSQFNEIISSSDAWTISDEVPEGEEGQASGLRPTISARRVKALIEQIIDRYAPLPELEYKLPFLLSIQLPILTAYHLRISSSLDAFESLSSAFVRAVPGALSGNTRSGIHIDQTKLTSGKAGLERLLKAWLSGKWLDEGMRKWADDLFFVEMSSDLKAATSLKYKFASDPLLPQAIKFSSPVGDADTTVSLFDVLIDRYDILCNRTEEMVVRLVTVEVENDLKLHLTRRWDNNERVEPSSQLLSSLTTYTSHLTLITSILPRIVVSRIYRKIVQHISNHILQRGVYAGWSKFSQMGGKDLSEEVEEWKDISRRVLGSTSSSSTNIDNGGGGGGLVIDTDVQWRRLEGIAKILALPSSDEEEGGGGGPTFTQAMGVAWSDSGSEARRSFLNRVGVDIGDEELIAVLRRRVECWR